MSCRRPNVEEVFKNCDGEYFGMSSGKEYQKKEVETIGMFHWSIPNHATDNWEADSSEDAVKAEK